jgi:hypothetical protein
MRQGFQEPVFRFVFIIIIIIINIVLRSPIESNPSMRVHKLKLDSLPVEVSFTNPILILILTRNPLNEFFSFCTQSNYWRYRTLFHMCPGIFIGFTNMRRLPFMLNTF